MQKFLDIKISKRPIKLRLVNNADLKFTLDLHNKNVEKKKFFSKKKVLLRDHKKWFKKSKNFYAATQYYFQMFDCLYNP